MAYDIHYIIGIVMWRGTFAKADVKRQRSLQVRDGHSNVFLPSSARHGNKCNYSCNLMHLKQRCFVVLPTRTTATFLCVRPRDQDKNIIITSVVVVIDVSLFLFLPMIIVVQPRRLLFATAVSLDACNLHFIMCIVYNIKSSRRA